MAYATDEDVAVLWARTPTDEEKALISRRLEQAERMIERRFRRSLLPTIAEQILDGTLLEADVVQVEADAVLRLIRNPEGYLSETDGNYTYMLRADLATGQMAITAEDWATLGIVQSRMSVLVPTFAIPT